MEPHRKSDRECQPAAQNRQHPKLHAPAEGQHSEFAYGERLTRFVVDHGSNVPDGTADLSNGEVWENPIGVNVLTEGFDVHRLETGVVYRDNGRNLDAMQIPLPDPLKDVR